MVHLPLQSTLAKLSGFWVLLPTAITAEGSRGPLWSPGALCWAEVGGTCPIWTPGVHLHRSGACYSEDKLAGADVKPAIMLLVLAHFIA